MGNSRLKILIVTEKQDRKLIEDKISFPKLIILNNMDKWV